MVKPLGTPSGVRTVTPSPASTAAQVPERLGLVKVRRHGRSPRFSNAAERKAHGASNSTSFSSSSGSGERFQIQTIGSFPTGWAMNASPGSVNPNIRTKSSPRRSSAWSSSVERSTRTSNSIAGWARLNEARAEGRIVSAKSCSIPNRIFPRIFSPATACTASSFSASSRRAYSRRTRPPSVSWTLRPAFSKSSTPAKSSRRRTQSAISLQMRRLEDLAGVELFEKAGRNVQLTEGGLVLLEYARRLLALNDEAVQAVSGLKMRGKIRLGMLQDFAETILPSALASFSRAHPAIELEVRVERSTELLNALERRGLDLVLMFGFTDPGEAFTAQPV